MLDSTTRARIDALRDTLVGKLPVPTEQVKQITLGLMYKFMGDLDEEYAKLGSKPFFAGRYEQYAWPNIMALTEATKRAELYAEGLEKMSLNPGIPQLFRDIFKGAFLPFRDPRIIGEFLKGIDEFKYEHSEDLGDAFEYLLQVSGEQGKAGQLRTPRHIIDFIVECVAPQKTDRILDPACGTAGFLISAYKHILRENTRPGSDRPGSGLTTTERNALRGNFTGYDVSHDMVRLSLVNMYLHLFPNPRIYEYDTLTSEDRWNEDADCILANPPFMTPKGGIRPHSRFRIKAKRSEILFVDYMLEHLSPNGKMGVVVPEGIIFQSNKAYRALRKLLVDGGYLYAVVSLPGGVFNPYSGVKTSILLIDRVLAKKAQDILFVKVENDGFDLGAQRRPIDKNDLPQAVKVVKAYKEAVAEGKDSRKAIERLLAGVALGEAKHLCVVPKTELGKDDRSLSADRYRTVVSVTKQEWPRVPLKEACLELKSGFAYGKSGKDSDGIPHLRPMNISPSGQLVWEGTKYIPKDVFRDNIEYALKAGDVLFNNTNSKELVGKTCYVATDLQAGFSNHLTRIRADSRKLNGQFLAFLLSSYWQHGVFLDKCHKWVGQAGISTTELGQIDIPLPPLSVQQEIVAELDGYQKVIDGARAVLDSYRPHIPIQPKWPVVALGAICSFKNGLNFSKGSTGAKVKIIGVRDFRTNLYAPLSELSEIHPDTPLTDDYLVKDGDILFVRSNGNPDLVGRSVIIPPTRERITFSGFTIRGRIEDSRALPLFYAYLFKSRDFSETVKTVGRGANIRNLTQDILNELRVPLPPISTQRQIVARIEEEQQLVQANRRLIELFEAKIRERIKEVWGE
jgi:type I restriction enzyme M protein